MNFKDKHRVRVEQAAGPTTDSDQPSPAPDSQDASAGVAEELAAWQEDYRCLAADFDNYRKRTRRDTEQQAAAQKEAFIGDLLPVLDNLERALASASSPVSAPLHAGVTLTLQQLAQLLQRHGIEPVEDVGQPFDPHRHSAVAVRHDPTQPDQIILVVIQRGYAHGDKVFRPAQVIVNDGSGSRGVGHAG